MLHLAGLAQELPEETDAAGWLAHTLSDNPPTPKKQPYRTRPKAKHYGRREHIYLHTRELLSGGATQGL